MREQDMTRRQLVQLLGTAAIGSIAGCTGIEQLGQQDTKTPLSSRASPPSTRSTREPTKTATATPRTSERATTQVTTTEPSVDSPAPDTPTEMAQTTDPPTTESPTIPTATDTPSDAPGYKQYHWHGRLFFEIDGDLVDFSQPVYYLKNLQQKHPETVYFHFHKSAHGVNEWSNEKKTVTFARALDLLPTIKYARRGGSHVVTYKGRTYRATMPGTSIDIYQGTESINPTTYTVQHGDNFWVRIGTRTSRTTTTDTRSGKLIIDINNRRLTFSSQRDRRTGTDRFAFRNDGHPYTWYTTQPVTLAEALNTLPDIKYRQGRGSTSVITYTASDAYSGTYRETSSGTDILTRQRWTDIDPMSYELQDGDILWIYIHTSRAPDNNH